MNRDVDDVHGKSWVQSPGREMGPCGANFGAAGGRTLDNSANVTNAEMVLWVRLYSLPFPSLKRNLRVSNSKFPDGVVENTHLHHQTEGANCESWVRFPGRAMERQLVVFKICQWE